MQTVQHANPNLNWYRSLSTILFVFLGGNVPLIAEEDYTAQVEAWRVNHEQRFKSPNGWLALIGHYWLQEGANRFGQDPSLEIPLPTDGLPKTFGAFRVTAGTVILEAPKGSGIHIDGQEATRTVLDIDNLKAEADCGSLIAIGNRITLQLVRRSNRLAVRVRDKESQSIKNFRGKNWFPIDRKYAIDATFTPYDPPKKTQIINIRGERSETDIIGALTFELDRQQYTLDAMTESPDDLFILFKDQTSGKSTYAPGRFLNAMMPIDGKVRLDFNQSYNPPCAFSPHTLCPLPPPENHLNTAIEAGERRYDK